MPTLTNVRESTIEKAANKILEAEGWRVEKVKFLNSGYPDRIYLHVSGTLVWIEYKAPGKEPGPLQYVRMRGLINRRQNVVWADNPRDAVWYCRRILASTRVPSGRYQNAPDAGGSCFIPGPWPWEAETLTTTKIV